MLVRSRNYKKNLPKLIQFGKTPNLNLLEQLKHCDNPNTQTNLLENWIVAVLDDIIPLKTNRLRPDSPKWLDGETKRLISIKNRFYRKVIDSARFSDSLWSQYKKFRNMVQSKVKHAKNNYLTKQFGKDTRTFFTEVNNLFGRKCKSNSVPKEMSNTKNEIVTDPSEIAAVLNHFFTEISSPKPTINVPKLQLPSAFDFSHVSIAEVANLITKLNSSKLGGTEQIQASVYKALISTVAPALTIIINNCLNIGCFPDRYKLALVTPVHKKGIASSAGNYRPISSLPVLSKVFEKVLSAQILDHLTNHSLLSPKQFGYRKGVSCEHMLLCLLDKFLLHLDNKNPQFIAVLSLDVKKAFDTVDHTLLIDKLRGLFGFSDHAASLLECYRNNRMQIMKVGTCTSPPLPISKGVPQGSIIGPLLFNLMVKGPVPPFH